MAHFLVYSKNSCPYCTATKGWLASQGHTYDEFNVEHDPDQRTILESKAPGARTVPQIFLGDYHIGGYEDLMLANQNGTLKMLLETAV